MYVTVLHCAARLCCSTRKQLAWNSWVHCKRVSAWHRMSVEDECVCHSSSLHCSIVLVYAQTASLEQQSALQAREGMVSHECWRRMCMSQFFTALRDCVVICIITSWVQHSALQMCEHMASQMLHKYHGKSEAWVQKCWKYHWKSQLPAPNAASSLETNTTGHHKTKQNGKHTSPKNSGRMVT